MFKPGGTYLFRGDRMREIDIDLFPLKPLNLTPPLFLF